MPHARKFCHDTAQQLFAEGLSYRDIARKLDVSHSAIFYTLRRRGVKIRNCRGSPRKFDHDEAFALRAEGLSYDVIGKRLGVSNVAVFKAVRLIKKAMTA